MKNLKPDTPPMTPIWGLQCAITPRLGARLVQQGRRLHFLADRAGLIGTFTPEALKALNVVFPVLIEKLENYLRSSELRQGEWHEIDLDRAVWEIPKERMKMRRPHVVPLSSQALTVLQQIKTLTAPSKITSFCISHHTTNGKRHFLLISAKCWLCIQ